MNTRRHARRIVLAHSGGLNSSAAVPWLAEANSADVITISLDLGQPGELEELRDRALATGAVRAHALDVREEFARDWVARSVKADALADDRWPLVSALSAPMLARKLVEIAAIEQTATVAHGAADAAAATRVENAVRAINPQLTVLAPARDWSMGVAKAALEASVRYLASDLGPKNIRVNAISAGAIKTLAASGISGFSNILQVYREHAPLRRGVDTSEVADAAVFLLSPAARAITGEIMMVDAGFHAMGGVVTTPRS